MASGVVVELVRIKIVYGENVEGAVSPPLQMLPNLVDLARAWRPPPAELLGPLVMNNVIVRCAKSEICRAGDNFTARRTVSFHQS
jgi:hypothetical protein